MASFNYLLTFLITILSNLQLSEAESISESDRYFNNEHIDVDVIKLLNVKDYMPNENDLPKVNTIENDAAYVLSKLSDAQLIRLLNDNPLKNEYDLNELVKIANHAKTAETFTAQKPDTYEPSNPVFRLDDKKVDPYSFNKNADPKNNALVKLSNMLYNRPRERVSGGNNENNEMLFDVLVAQLKALCCKKNDYVKSNKALKLQKILQNIMLMKNTSGKDKVSLKDLSKEQMFLVINDDIKSNINDDLIAVNPNSLSSNSSVLLLGPINKPISETQLKLAMNLMANELSKPEYLPLLKKISEGSVSESSVALMNSLITGPESRRYIKPHRCNHQSKLARVYGGPKWLICTGYLNLNTPSLYD